LQCDPLGIAGGYNLYAYLANPLTGVDILGLRCDPEERGESDSPEGESRTTQTRPPRLDELHGWVDTYGRQLKVTQPEDAPRPVDRDHQPPKGAIKEAAIDARNDMVARGVIPQPSPKQWKKIEGRIDRAGLSVVVDKQVHKAGPSYGKTRNSAWTAKAKEDLGATARQEADAMVANSRKYDPDNEDAYKAAADKIKGQTHEGIMMDVREIIIDEMDIEAQLELF
jgi:hypothetical protein